MYVYTYNLLCVDVSISDYHGERGGRREGGRAGGEVRGPAHAAGFQCSRGQDTTGGRRGPRESEADAVDVVSYIIVLIYMYMFFFLLSHLSLKHVYISPSISRIINSSCI